MKLLNWLKNLNNMKMYGYHKFILLLMFLFGTSAETINAQDSAAAPPTLLSINYFLPVNNISVNIYFNEGEQKNLLGKVTTDTIGKGRIGLPPTFKNTWDSIDEFKFIAKSDSTAAQEPLT